MRVVERFDGVRGQAAERESDTPTVSVPWLVPFVANDATDGNGLTCHSPEGLTSGYFSSVIEVFGR